MLPSNNYITGKTSIYVLLVILAAISGIVYLDYLNGTYLLQFKGIGSDTLNVYYPKYYHLSEYVRTTGFPAWSFSQGLGQNIFPNSLGNPFTAVLALISPDRIDDALVWLELSKIFIVAIVFFLYLRLLSFAPYTTVIGAILFSYSAFMILGGTWYVFSTQTVLFVLLLYGFERIFVLRSYWLFPLSVCLVATSKAFYLYPFSIFFLVYTLFRFIDEKGLQWKELGQLLSKLALLGLLGVAMGAVFFIANTMEILSSPRASGNVSLTNSLMSTPLFETGSLLQNLTVLYRLYSSDIIGTGSDFRGWNNYLEAPMFYCGILTLVLAPQVFSSLDKRRRILYAIVMVLFITPVIFPHIRYLLWLYSGNYYRISSLFIVFMVMHLALRGLHYAESDAKINIKILAVTVLLLASLLLLITIFGTIETDHKRLAYAIILILIYGILLSTIRCKELHQLSLLALLAVVSIEAAGFSYPAVNHRNAMTKLSSELPAGYNDGTRNAIKFINRLDKGVYRIEKTYSSGPSEYKSLNDAKIQGYMGTSTYHSFNNPSYIQFLSAVEYLETNVLGSGRWIRPLFHSPLLASFTSVKYLLVKSDEEITEFKKRGYTLLGQAGDIRILHNQLYLPFGFAYNAYISNDEFNNLNANEKTMSLFQAAVLDPSYVRQQLHQIKSTDIHGTQDLKNHLNNIKSLRDHAFDIEYFSQNRITGSIDADQTRFLLFTIPYDRGWHATIDGEPAKLARASIGFIGIMLAPGKHIVELQYHLPYFKLSLLITILATTIYIAFVWQTRAKKLT